MNNQASGNKQNTNPFPKMEERVLNFWEKNKIFEKSVENPPHPLYQGGIKSPSPPLLKGAIAQGGERKNYVFYDGPPFGTGEPHYGHLLSSISKDVVPRFWTMRGFRVERRWGWDCHGLPIENIIEQELKISGKKEIEKIGIVKFNEACRARVLEYADIWDKMIRRIGRWVEFKNSYKTMDLSYMESVWWAFKELWQKGLVYEGRKVLLYCPRCETPISNFEVAMDNSYKDITEKSVTVKFEVKYKAGKTGRGIGALILNEKNQVLLVKRNEKGRRVTWALPGGKLEFGEKWSEALKREIKEELGADIKSAKAFSRKADIFEGRLFETVCFEVRLNQEPKIMVPDELEKLEWFSLDNLPEIDYPPSKDAINIFKKKNHEVIDESIESALPKVFILAWTTTPWTLPGNVALAVGEKIDYCLVELVTYDGGPDGSAAIDMKELGKYKKPHAKVEKFIIAKDKLADVLKDNKYEVINKIKGKDLVGLEYEPLFNVPAFKESGKKVYRVVAGDFVTTDEGTGIVHTAVVYGEDDYNLGLKLDLPVVPALDNKGHFNETVPQFTGIYFLKANKIIIEDLEKRGLLFKAEDYKHSYPHCHRCETQLFYNAIPAWFLNIGKLRKRMLGLNKKINWFPKHLKQGRFAQGIEQAPDWNISRNRFFATPIPVWRCDKCGEMEVIGSVSELKEKSGEKNIIDIHSHKIDQLSWPCQKCTSTGSASSHRAGSAQAGAMKRISEVFDCWVESGSMPFAQHHYPFENKKKFEDNFPAQFITEYISQTRAWFYVTHAISTALFNSHSFENVVATGVILNEKGEKLSKSKKNYPDPWKVINEYGADALRFYLMSSSVMAAENLFFNERELQDIFRKNIMILWNVYKFYEMFTGGNEKNITPPTPPCQGGDSNVLDRWILARLYQLIAEVTASMEKYDLPRATRPITEFINDLSTWYIRRSRDRFKLTPQPPFERGAKGVSDREAAITTTKYVLIELAKVMAPFMPFMAEQIWQKVSGNDFKDENKSVHLEQWTETQITDKKDERVLEEMAVVRKIVELGLAKRDEAGVKVRQPLRELQITNYKLQIKYEDLIKDELNVKKVVAEKGKGELKVELDTAMTDDLKLEGLKREIVRMVNNLRKQAGLTIKDKIILSWQSDSAMVKKVFSQMAEELKKDTLSAEVVEDKIKGEEVKVNGESVKLEIRKK